MSLYERHISAAFDLVDLLSECCATVGLYS